MTDPEEIIDARTGEVIPKGEIQTLPQRDVAVLQINANNIGTLELSPGTEAILDEALKPEQVKIRPDGLVYLPWTWYAERLNRAFGRLKWGLVPQGSPQSKDMGNNNVLVIWGFWLIVKGIPVSFAVGECSYRTDNNTMSYADAIAGAKSIALARNCKEMGMALSLWDADWIVEWKGRYAEKRDNGKGKMLWYKKGEKTAIKATPKPQPTQEESQLEKDFPVPAEEANDGWTVKEILGNKKRQMEDLIQLTGKKPVEIVKFLNTLDHNRKYSLIEIERSMTQGED